MPPVLGAELRAPLEPALEALYRVRLLALCAQLPDVPLLVAELCTSAALCHKEAPLLLLAGSLLRAGQQPKLRAGQQLSCCKAPGWCGGCWLGGLLGCFGLLATSVKLLPASSKPVPLQARGGTNSSSSGEPMAAGLLRCLR